MELSALCDNIKYAYNYRTKATALYRYKIISRLLHIYASTLKIATKGFSVLYALVDRKQPQKSREKFDPARNS